MFTMAFCLGLSKTTAWGSRIQTKAGGKADQMWGLTTGLKLKQCTGRKELHREEIRKSAWEPPEPGYKWSCLHAESGVLNEDSRGHTVGRNTDVFSRHCRESLKNTLEIQLRSRKGHNLGLGPPGPREGMHSTLHNKNKGWHSAVSSWPMNN